VERRRHTGDVALEDGCRQRQRFGVREIELAREVVGLGIAEAMSARWLSSSALWPRSAVQLSVRGTLLPCTRRLAARKA